MEKKNNQLTEKNLIDPAGHAEPPVTNSCCGGAPVNSSIACCKADEDQKIAGREGCACKSVSGRHKRPSCC